MTDRKDGTPLRVAVVTLYPLDSAHMIGGERVAAFNLVQGLQAFDDLDVHVVYCHNDVERDAIVQQGRATIHFLVPPIRRPLPKYVTTLGRIGQALAEIKPHIVNGHEPHYCIPALRAGLPTVLTLHGVAHREAAIFNRTLYDRLRFGMAMLYDRYTLARISDIVAISPYIVREYTGATRARWHRIDNPLPDEYFTLERQEDSHSLLFAGSIIPLKDIGTLLRAILIVRESLPDVRLRLAGRLADQGYETELRRFVNEHDLQANVEFLGLLDTPAMLRQYAKAALVILPSRQEVLPMTIIEAMAAGVPVVATRAGGLADLVTGSTGILVEIGDDAAMAAAISRLLQDDELRHSMGQQARVMAEGRFRAANVAASYRRLYLDLTSREP